MHVAKHRAAQSVLAGLRSQLQALKTFRLVRGFRTSSKTNSFFSQLSPPRPQPGIIDDMKYHITRRLYSQHMYFPSQNPGVM